MAGVDMGVLDQGESRPSSWSGHPRAPITPSIPRCFFTIASRYPGFSQKDFLTTGPTTGALVPCLWSPVPRSDVDVIRLRVTREMLRFARSDALDEIRPFALDASKLISRGRPEEGSAPHGLRERRGPLRAGRRRR